MSGALREGEEQPPQNGRRVREFPGLNVTGGVNKSSEHSLQSQLSLKRN